MLPCAFSPMVLSLLCLGLSEHYLVSDLSKRHNVMNLNRRAILKAVNENLQGFAYIAYSSEWKEYRVREWAGAEWYYTNSLIDAIETAMQIRNSRIADTWFNS